jgi:competence protein ComEA
MIYTTGRERLMLAALGASAVIGLGLLVWQQRRTPLTVEPVMDVPQAASWESELRTARQVDLNAATAEELERLPEVGPSLAQRIIEYRRTLGRFRRTDELLRVPGIGLKTYEALQDHVTVR